MESSEFKFKSGFISIEEAIRKERLDRESIDPDKVPKYELKCLNDFLFGIGRSQLIVIGADSGVGKTHIANSLARVNGLAGRRVYLFSLEGDKNEIISRWIWERMCVEYYKDPTGIHMDYNLFLNNKLPGLEKYYDTALEEILALKDNIFIHDKLSRGFTQKDLVKQIGKMDRPDLIIIDHLHYFTMFDDRSEASQISEIMRKIRDITESWGVPVVLISHLRKKEKNRGMPDNEDFMGSSNIAKVASTTILLASDYKNKVGNLYPTFIRIGKDRSGHPQDIGFSVMFNKDTRMYEKEYKLVNMWEREVKYFANEKDYPNWCKKVIDCNAEKETLIGRMEAYKKKESDWDE